MVSKSYVVNECPTLADDDHKSVKNAQLAADSDQMSKIDRYILHISNEMVSGERHFVCRCVTRIIKDSASQGHLHINKK